MKKTRITAIILSVMLIAASAMLWSCGGGTSFKVEVTDDKGVTTVFTFETNEETLEAALLHDDIKFISLGDFGMVATVNGITADFSVDEGWWKILINGEEATVGASDIKIEAGAVYSFVYTIGFDMGDWE